jgi:hypothetical protein
MMKYTDQYWPAFVPVTERSRLVYIRHDVVRMNPVKALYKRVKAALTPKRRTPVKKKN